jgi:hypothetical protein
MVVYLIGTHPGETQGLLLGIYNWTSAHPILTSSAILIGTTLLLLPSLLVGAGALAVIAGLGQVRRAVLTSGLCLCIHAHAYVRMLHWRSHALST